MPELPLQGRAAIVTGSSGAVGGAIARRLAAAGAAIVVNGRRAEPTQETLESIRGAGGRAEAVVGDALDREVVRSLVDKALEAFGGVHIIVNNIGGRKGGPFLDLPEDDWNAVFRMNLTGAFFLAQMSLPHMIKSGWGRVINMSSLGFSGVVNAANYAAAKGAAVSFTKSLALEFGRHGITVNCIVPGQMDTPKSAGVIGGNRERLVSRIPIGRLGRPEDVAGAAAFLASDEAGYITGHTLLVTGGRESVDFDVVPN